MSRFSIRNPYFIVVVCLALMVIGVTSLVRMPVDLFPSINLPEVVVATFYSGMPPQDIETDITDPLERFFTLASGIDHMESRSLLGVSIIKVISNLERMLTPTLRNCPIWHWPISNDSRPARYHRSCSSSTPPACRFVS